MHLSCLYFCGLSLFSQFRAGWQLLVGIELVFATEVYTTLQARPKPRPTVLPLVVLFKRPPMLECRVAAIIVTSYDSLVVRVHVASVILVSQRVPTAIQ